MHKPYLGEELTEVVRRWAQPTTPLELQARGVRSIRSISMDRIAGLIEKAVNRTLLSRTLGGHVEDHETFSEAAREEFVRLVRGKHESSASPGQSDAAVGKHASLDESCAESALDRLKRDLRSRRRELQEQQSALTNGPEVEGSEDGELEVRLRQLFSAWGGRPEDFTSVESEVIRLSVSELRNERRRSQQSLIDRHRREMDVLERRLTKLSTELERTEAELARVAAGGAVSEDGLASIYSEVQGLSNRDSDHERKGELMSAIFEANLELQTKLELPLPLDDHVRTPVKTLTPRPRVAKPSAERESKRRPMRFLTAMPAPAMPAPQKPSALAGEDR